MQSSWLVKINSHDKNQLGFALQQMVADSAVNHSVQWLTGFQDGFENGPTTKEV